MSRPPRVGASRPTARVNACWTRHCLRRTLTAPGGAVRSAKPRMTLEPDLARRRQTHLVLWRPADADPPPALVIGRFAASDPPTPAEVRTLTLGVDAASANLWTIALRDRRPQSRRSPLRQLRGHARTADRVPRDHRPARPDVYHPGGPTTQRSRSTSSPGAKGPRPPPSASLPRRPARPSDSSQPSVNTLTGSRPIVSSPGSRFALLVRRPSGRRVRDEPPLSARKGVRLSPAECSGSAGRGSLDRRCA